MSKSRRFFRDVDGVLLLDKPLGLSSNAALQRARELFAAVKAGHAGSLDPLASGQLPVCFGQATKVCGRLLTSGKSYRVEVQLGARTESGDRETPIIEQAPVPDLTPAQVDGVLSSFLGSQLQIPPMHSALKHEGQRLYELARRGESVERAAREVFIHRIERAGLTRTSLTFEVYCSKGTYIRTLAMDIAARLGTIGFLAALRRTWVDPFAGQRMYTLEELERWAPERLSEALLPADLAFADLPAVELTLTAEHHLLQGQTVAGATPEGTRECRAYGAGGRFLGLATCVDARRIRPVRLFVDPLEAAPAT